MDYNRLTEVFMRSDSSHVGRCMEVSQWGEPVQDTLTEVNC